MSVFGSIFGKNRLGKGSPRPPALRGATHGKIWQKAQGEILNENGECQSVE